MLEQDIIVIGAGVTGLTCAHALRRRGKQVLLLEQQDRVGGLIQTVTEDGFTFESGPNTGVLKYPEVAELFEQLSGLCQLETAQAHSKCRLIWQGDRFHPLPSGLMSALATPLFTWYDKFRILGEPWRKPGTDPNETVGSLAERRLGKSYVRYAVDPFISGVFAGDPYQIPTRWALPKLYALEQEHGSFIRSSIAKARQPKTERDRKATRQVFSTQGGFSRLVEALSASIGPENILTSAQHITLTPDGQQGWIVTCQRAGEELQFHARQVITTCPAYALPELLPFVDADTLHALSDLQYSPVVQIGVGLRDCGTRRWQAFGGLIPSCEQKQLLGILFPSACFTHRAPEAGAAFAYFLGGVRHPEYLQKSDAELISLVNDSLSSMLKYPREQQADIIRIFRHARAIPQYGNNTRDRLLAIDRLQHQYPTLTLAGNLRDGIGIADRIKQAVTVANQVC